MCENCKSARSNLASRRSFLSAAVAAVATLAAPSDLRAKAKAKALPETAPPKPENVLSSEQALARLMEGNKRYVQGITKRHDFAAEREALSEGQNPYAGILSCADSRIAPEFAFDSGRGDLFVVRVAGNFLTPENLASFEFAVDVLKTPFLMVLGHDACGAIKAAISSIQKTTTLPGHLPSLVDNLAPAVDAASALPGDLLQNATTENVRRNVQALKTATPLISAAVSDKRVQVRGAVYRLATGEVQLID